MTLALLLVAQMSLPAIITVSGQASGREQTVVVRVEPELGGLDFTQDGSTVELSLKGTVAPMFEAPPPIESVETVQIYRNEEGVGLRIQLAEGVLAVLRRTDRNTVTLALQSAEEPAGVAVAGVVGATQVAETGRAEPAQAPPEVEALFPLLFPSGAPEGLEQEQPDRDEPDEDGVRFGPFTLRPGIQVTYVAAKSTFLDTPEPAETTYIQIQPRLEALAAVRLGNGLLTGRYEPSFRTGSDFAVVNQTTHLGEATLNMPLTPVTTFDADYRFVRGSLEAREVDPGDEYFFGLGRFTRHGARAGLEVETGSRTALEVSGYYDDIAFDESDRGFYSHERYGADAGLRYEIGPTMRALVGYAFDGIPQPLDRPVAESSAHTAFVRFDGELGPLTSGTARAGYRWQTNPNGVGEGQSWDGLVLDASLKRDFSPASWVRVGAARTTYPSAFEADGFYVSSSVLAQLLVPLPLGVAFTGGVSWRTNDYQVVVPELGEPRADDIFGWSVGLARSLSPWAFLRADFRKDRRRSNVDAFDIDTHALTIQLGISPFRGAQR